MSENCNPILNGYNWGYYNWVKDKYGAKPNGSFGLDKEKTNGIVKHKVFFELRHDRNNPLYE
jgi:hypothetical protein